MRLAPGVNPMNSSHACIDQLVNTTVFNVTCSHWCIQTQYTLAGQFEYFVSKNKHFIVACE